MGKTIYYAKLLQIPSLISEKIEFKTKNTTRDKDVYNIMRKFRPICWWMGCGMRKKIKLKNKYQGFHALSKRTDRDTND